MRTIRSALADGRTAKTATTVESVNPADLTDVVARVELSGPDGVVAAASAAKAAQPSWAAVPAPVRGQVVAAIGRIVADNADALARPGHPGGGQAAGGGPGRGAGDRRHVRLLPG